MSKQTRAASSPASAAEQSPTAPTQIGNELPLIQAVREALAALQKARGDAEATQLQHDAIAEKLERLITSDADLTVSDTAQEAADFERQVRVLAIRHSQQLSFIDRAEEALGEAIRKASANLSTHIFKARTAFVERTAAELRRFFRNKETAKRIAAEADAAAALHSLGWQAQQNRDHVGTGGARRLLGYLDQFKAIEAANGGN